MYSILFSGSFEIPYGNALKLNWKAGTFQHNSLNLVALVFLYFIPISVGMQLSCTCVRVDWTVNEYARGHLLPVAFELRPVFETLVVRGSFLTTIMAKKKLLCLDKKPCLKNINQMCKSWGFLNAI